MARIARVLREGSGVSEGTASQLRVLLWPTSSRSIWIDLIRLSFTLIHSTYFPHLNKDKVFICRGCDVAGADVRGLNRSSTAAGYKQG